MAGNANSGKRRNQYTFEALLLEMKQREKEGDRKGLRGMVMAVWDLAESGERWAVEFIRDTVDGKPMQQVEHSGSISTPSTLTDSDLASIIEGGSSDGATETPPSPSQLN
jgi:hypothetical protein